MTMTWSRAASGATTARGLRGCYTIRFLGTHYTLTGRGYDDLPVLNLPPYGRLFDTAEDAQEHAEKVERFGAVEGQVSGT